MNRRQGRLFSLVLLACLMPALGACTVSRRTTTLEITRPGITPAFAQRTLTVGQNLQLELSLGGASAQAGALRWSSDRPQVAAVSSSGMVSAASEGTATIRASLAPSGGALAGGALAGGTLAEFRVQVTAQPPAVPQRLDAFTAQVLELTNAARARGQTCGGQVYAPAPPLQPEARLGDVAQAHAADMAARDYFGHVSPDGRTPKDRITASGYDWRLVAENLAAGQPDAQEAVAGWLGSEGHCRNLMNAEYRELGIGTAQNVGGKRYWVQEFGTR